MIGKLFRFIHVNPCAVTEFLVTGLWLIFLYFRVNLYIVEWCVMKDEGLIFDWRSNILSWRTLGREILSHFRLCAERQDARWLGSELCCTDILSVRFGVVCYFWVKAHDNFEWKSSWLHYELGGGDRVVNPHCHGFSCISNSEGIHCYVNEAETKLAGRRHDIWGSCEA